MWFQDLGPPRPEKTNWCAVLLAFLSGVFFTLCSALVKGLKSIAPMELLVLRSSVQVAAMLPIVAFRGNNPFGPSGLRGLLALQVNTYFLSFIFQVKKNRSIIFLFFLLKSYKSVIKLTGSCRRSHVGATFLLVQTAASGRRNFNYFQFPSVRLVAVLRLPEGALRFPPHAHRFCFGHRRGANCQTTSSF